MRRTCGSVLLEAFWDLRFARNPTNPFSAHLLFQKYVKNASRAFQSGLSNCCHAARGFYSSHDAKETNLGFSPRHTATKAEFTLPILVLIVRDTFLRPKPRPFPSPIPMTTRSESTRIWSSIERGCTTQATRRWSPSAPPHERRGCIARATRSIATPTPNITNTPQHLQTHFLTHRTQASSSSPPHNASLLRPPNPRRRNVQPSHQKQPKNRCPRRLPRRSFHYPLLGSYL